jgi:tight adherence protein C
MTTSTRVADFRLADWLPYWLGVDDLIGALAALAVLVAMIGVYNALRSHNPFERRFAAIAQRKESLRRAALDSGRTRRRVHAAGLMSEAVSRLNLLRSHHATEARALLAQAGMRTREAMIRYLFARACMPLVFASAMVADSYGAHVLPVPPNFRWAAAFGAAMFGFFAPGVYIKNLVTKRGKLLTLGLPDALDLMVICAEAGLSLDASLTRVSRELEPTWPEISEELGITAAELTFLPERRQAFENLNGRTNLAAVRGVVNTLLQTAKFGTPLAQSLRVLAAEYREARIVRAEEKAARLPAMLTVPMILFILPTLFIVLLGPAALNIIDTFSGKKGAQTTTVQSNGAGAGAGDPATVVDKSKPSSSGAGASSGGGTVIIESRDASATPEPDVELLPTKSALRIIDPVVVDLDARKLRTGFQHRLAVVPTGKPDKIADAAAFARDSIPVQPSRMRVFTAARASGSNEIRLYYIPQFGTDLVVAARVTIEVAPGAPGATEVSQLIREASALGQASFASNYRDRSLTIEGQFLRSEPRSADQLASVGLLRSVVDPGKAYAAIFLGWTEPQASSNGGPREVLCLAAADDPALQARTGALRAGEPLVVRGTPSGWGAVFDTTAIILRSCQIAP